MFEKEVLEIAKDVYMHHFDDDVKYPDVLNAIIIGTQRGAEFGFQKGIKAKINTTTISDYTAKDDKLTEAKNIIQDLLNNSDEYARQRAIDYLKEE